VRTRGLHSLHAFLHEGLFLGNHLDLLLFGREVNQGDDLCTTVNCGKKEEKDGDDFDIIDE